jgi:protein-disulfide isomerase
MPKRNRNASRKQTSSFHIPWNALLAAGAVVVVIIIIAVVALRPGPSNNIVSFPAREMGPSSAQVVVEEFADYQCPYCGMFHSVAETRLRETYVQTGKVRFIFENYPIVGNESQLAANAALCAGDQDAFWEYHDFLYANQGAENSGAFSSPRLETFAAQLHLDSVKFDQCLGNTAHADVISGDVQQGHRYGIQGTPTFFVNGHLVSITVQDTTFQGLFDAIDKALRP